MQGTSASPDRLNAQQRSAHIRELVLARGVELRKRYPILNHVELGNVIQQTQVLNPWWLWPFQAFCFNFGSTHGIHHFVVKEPFYLRQMTAPVAHKVMAEMGVRFNDFGTFGRANRFLCKEEVVREAIKTARA